MQVLGVRLKYLGSSLRSIGFAAHCSHHEGHEEHEKDHRKSERKFLDSFPLVQRFQEDSFLRVLRGEISLCVLLNDPVIP